MQNVVFSNFSVHQLVVHYQQTADNASFGELYNRYYEKVFKYCVTITKDRDTSFDLTQEVFLRAATNLHRLEHATTFTSWLFRIAHNLCIDFCKQQVKSRVSNLDDRFDVEDPSVEEEVYLEHDQQYNTMLALVEALEETDRELLVAKYVEKLSIKELQVKLGLSGSAVKMRLLRLRNKMSAKLESQYVEVAAFG